MHTQGWNESEQIDRPKPRDNGDYVIINNVAVTRQAAVAFIKQRNAQRRLVALSKTQMAKTTKRKTVRATKRRKASEPAKKRHGELAPMPRRQGKGQARSPSPRRNFNLSMDAHYGNDVQKMKSARHSPLPPLQVKERHGKVSAPDVQHDGYRLGTPT